MDHLKIIIQQFLNYAKNDLNIALIDFDGSFTFKALYYEVLQLEQKLLKDPNPIYIISQRNSRKHFVAFLACVLADKIYCPLNPQTLSTKPIEIKAVAPGIAALFYTSGSTGSPKGIFIKAVTIEANIKNSTDAQKFDRSSLVLAHLNFAHSGGFFHQALPALLNFSKIIIQDKFLPKKIIKTILEFKPTHIILLPSQLGLLEKSKTWNEYQKHNFKYILTGSQNITAKFIQKALNNCEILLNVYGSTECGPFAISHAFKKPFTLLEVPPMGSPVKELQWKISPDQELLVRGDLVSEDKHDYFKTNDLVKYENNLFYFISRKNDLFQVGGLTVNPIEVEQKILEQIPSIEECLMFPIPHSQLVNIPGLLVKLKSNAPLDPSINKHLAFLEKHCFPQILIAVPNIPLNNNSKPDRLAAVQIYKNARSDRQQK